MKGIKIAKRLIRLYVTVPWSASPSRSLCEAKVDNWRMLLGVIEGE